MTQRWMTGPEIAAHLGIKPATWRAYVSRGQAPPADDPDAEGPPQRRNPRWRKATIDDWLKTRRQQL